MTIRRRLTLWYVGILLGSLVIMAGVLHYEWAEQLQWAREGKPALETVWEEVGEALLFYGVPTILVLVVGGGWLLRRALEPVATLTRAAERIHAHNLQERLPRTGQPEELERLTEVFNSMMARLDQAFTHIRDFTIHASHELKTPLTLMRVETETRLRDSAKAPEEREFLANLLDEIDRLRKIVDGLTLLAKAD